MINVRDLNVVRGGRTICCVPELKVERGECVTVQGPNGSGKSTLLRVLAGLIRDFSGNFTVDAAPRDILFVHQTPLLFRGTVRHNVEYGLKARGLSAKERRSVADPWLERLGLKEPADRRVDNLSGGETRRTALARALVLNPAVLLLDEPFSDLDQSGIDEVSRLLGDLDATIVIASPTSIPRECVNRSVHIAEAVA